MKKEIKKIPSKPFWINKTTGQTFLPGTITKEQKQDCEYFDSVLEYKAYLYLCKKYDKCFVSRQTEIALLPANEYFSSLTWKVDFTVFTIDGTLLYECKGQWILHDNFALADFKKTLRLLQISHPKHFANLRLISDETWTIPGTRIMVKKINEI